MSTEQIKILELIASASDDVHVENLLNKLIHEASFNDVVQIRALLNDWLAWEIAPEAKYNYRKALEFLD